MAVVRVLIITGTGTGTARAFEIVVDGITPADDPVAAAAKAQAAADAGATWWIEANWSPEGAARLEARIAAGPPRTR